jgi:hypothetical protein
MIPAIFRPGIVNISVNKFFRNYFRNTELISEAYCTLFPVSFTKPYKLRTMSMFCVHLLCSYCALIVQLLHSKCTVSIYKVYSKYDDGMAKIWMRLEKGQAKDIRASPFGDLGRRKGINFGLKSA